MNFFCRLFGHTWIPVTEDSNPRWNTTKAMHTLELSDAGATRYFDECRRCGVRREASVRGDYDARGTQSEPEASAAS